MKRLTIAVDFDGTCVHDAFPHVGRDMFGAELALKRMMDDGHRLILWSCREHFPYMDVPDVLDVAMKWFEDRGIKLWAINGNPEMILHDYPIARKCHADIVIDDHAIGIPRLSNGDIDWHLIYSEVKRLSEG